MLRYRGRCSLQPCDIAPASLAKSVFLLFSFLYLIISGSILNIEEAKCRPVVIIWLVLANRNCVNAVRTSRRLWVLLDRQLDKCQASSSAWQAPWPEVGNGA